MDEHHIVSVSGGKDSTATYLLAIEWSQRTGRPFRAVFADTGNEHPVTYDYVRSLPVLSGGPEIEWVRADFSADIERKRRYIAEKWPGKGVSAERVARALELLHPTGNPFLDLCMVKGRFPSRTAQFCTERLKVLPIREQIVLPILEDGGTVWSWQGVRREEGKTHDHPRANLPRNEHQGGNYWVTRPIIEWTVEQVFEQHHKHGIRPNPLYRQGMGRVGCMPCINCQKDELAEIDARAPSEISRIEEWDPLVSEVSRRGCSTFFPVANDPTMAGVANEDINPRDHGIRRMVEWAKTTRGGRSYDLLRFNNDTNACRSSYGLCE